MSSSTLVNYVMVQFTTASKEVVSCTEKKFQDPGGIYCDQPFQQSEMTMTKVSLF